jgi:hypothetical protein
VHPEDLRDRLLAGYVGKEKLGPRGVDHDDIKMEMSQQHPKLAS